MDQTAFQGPGDTRKHGLFRIGMKGLMVLVASCALIIWATLSIRYHLEGYQPLRVIRSGNAFDRRKAAQELAAEGSIDPGEAMAALTDTLADEDAEVRAMAARSLAVLVYEWNHPPGAPIAADLLKRRIEVAMRVLVPLMSDRDPGVRAAAATSLGLLASGPNPRRPTPQQLAALLEASNTVRRQAARVINGIPDIPLPPELVAALHDESAEVRAAAARTLVRFGPDLDPHVPALIAMIERDLTDVRKACAQALEAAWPTPALVPTLMELIKSPDRGTRFHAAKVLGRIGPEANAAIPALIAVLNEPLVSDPDPARGAARALGQMGPNREAIEALIAVISPENVERHLAALHWVPHVGPPTVDGERVGAESLRIVSAMQGLGDIGPPAVAAIPALIAAYSKAMEYHYMAYATIPAALGRIAPRSAAAPDAVAALIRGLDSDFRLEAIEALGPFGAEASAAIPKLRALEEDSDRSIRDAAVKALEAIETRSQPDAGGERGLRNRK